MKTTTGTLTRVFEEIAIPDKAVVHEHPSGAKYTAFAFSFPDGYPATLVVTKGVKSKWVPSRDISRILIEFNES